MGERGERLIYFPSGGGVDDLYVYVHGARGRLNVP